MTSRRARAGRSGLVPIIVCLLLLSAGPIAAGASAMTAGHTDGPPTDDEIRIDDDLPANGTSVEVIVRLEDAPATDTAVAADETDVEVDRLTRYGAGIVDADAAAAELVERTSEVESSMESGGDSNGGQSDESAADGGSTAGDAAGIGWPGQLATVGLAVVLGLCVVTALSGSGIGDSSSSRLFSLGPRIRRGWR